jgi:hypothetical protein
MVYLQHLFLGRPKELPILTFWYEYTRKYWYIIKLFGKSFKHFFCIARSVNFIAATDLLFFASWLIEYISFTLS